MRLLDHPLSRMISVVRAQLLLALHPPDEHFLAAQRIAVDLNAVRMAKPLAGDG
jgi:hypothetical protein